MTGWAAVFLTLVMFVVVGWLPTLGLQLASLGFRWLTGRPRHWLAVFWPALGYGALVAFVGAVQLWSELTDALR